MADEDREYARWVRAQTCDLCGLPPPMVVIHHSTNGTMNPVIPGPDGLVMDGPSRGKGQRAHDHWGIPLCDKLRGGRGCHQDLHGLRGHFRNFTLGELREWQRRKVFEYRIRYLDTEVF